MDKDASFWDQLYESGGFRERWEYAFPSHELVTAVAAGLAQGGTPALDIGCGAGREAIFLAECGLTVIGLDLSAKALEIARRRAEEKGVRVDWRQGDARRMPVESASIAFANDRGCLHHIGDADREEYASEVARVLRPGGILLLRGACRQTDEFVAVTPAAVGKHFGGPHFVHGPILPIAFVSDAGILKANIVVVRRI